MSTSIGIVGWGNSARALAFYLSQKGYGIWIYVRNTEKYASFSEQLELRASGMMNGTIKLLGMTSDIQMFLDKNPLIFVATETRSYQDIASNFDPYLKPHHHQIILFSGKLFGCLAFESGLKHTQASSLDVLETDAIFAARIQEDDSIWIRGIKKWTLFGAARSSQAARTAPLIKHFFPNLEQATHLIQRGLTDFGALAHPIISLANISKIDRGETFFFYYDGLSNNTIGLLEEAEKEFRLLANAYNSPLIPMKELLNRYYGCDTSSLGSAIKSVPNYKDSIAPKQLGHRYLQEDVSCTLVPMLELAKLAGIELPTIASAVHICSVLAKKDFKSEGRRLKSIGLESFSAADLLSSLES